MESYNFGDSIMSALEEIGSPCRAWLWWRPWTMVQRGWGNYAHMITIAEQIRGKCSRPLIEIAKWIFMLVLYYRPRIVLSSYSCSTMWPSSSLDALVPWLIVVFSFEHSPPKTPQVPDSTDGYSHMACFHCGEEWATEKALGAIFPHPPHLLHTPPTVLSSPSPPWLIVVL